MDWAPGSQLWPLHSQLPISTLIWVFRFPWHQGEQNDFSVSRRETLLTSQTQITSSIKQVDVWCKVDNKRRDTQAGEGWCLHYFFMSLVCVSVWGGNVIGTLWMWDSLWLDTVSIFSTLWLWPLDHVTFSLDVILLARSKANPAHLPQCEVSCVYFQQVQYNEFPQE